MIKYNFKVEVPFLDKTNNKKEVKKDAILVVTEERLKELNEAKVGRVISAVYEEEKTDIKTTKATKTKKNEEAKADEAAETTEETAETTEETAGTAEEAAKENADKTEE